MQLIITKDGKPVSLPSGCRATLRITESATSVRGYSAKIEDAGRGVIFREGNIEMAEGAELDVLITYPPEKDKPSARVEPFACSVVSQMADMSTTESWAASNPPDGRRSKSSKAASGE